MNSSWQVPVFIALAAAAALVFVLGLFALISNWRDPARRRLAGINAEDSAGTPPADPLDQLVKAIGPVGRLLVSGSGKERDRIDRLLHLAGFRSPTVSTAFYGAKGALGLLLPVLWLLVSSSLPNVTTRTVWFVAIALLFVGMVAPNKWLESRVAARQQKLRNAFPDALDLLVICVEAGLGLAAAIERVADELRFSHPELAEELSLVNIEMRAGVERETALRNLAERTGLEDIKGLVSLLVQTLRFGTSVADTLRVFADEFRDQRTQAAEEQAAKIGTKLIFPLILCEFPAFFVVTIGPVIVRIFEMFPGATK